jgi:hypothetical protein
MRQVVAAKMEDLGDLKLYRLPLPTTVAARGKSRLPCLPRRIVVEQVLTADLGSDDDDNTPDVGMVVRLRNRKENGLGLALPKGAVRVCPTEWRRTASGAGANHRSRRQRGRTSPGTSPQVTVRNTVHRRKGAREMAVTVSNAGSGIVRRCLRECRARCRQGCDGTADPATAVVSGSPIPAHGKKTLRYRLMP